MAKVYNNCEPRHVDPMFYEDDPNRQCASPNGAVFPFYIPSFYDSFQAFGGSMLNQLSAVISPRSTNLLTRVRAQGLFCACSTAIGLALVFFSCVTCVAQHVSPNAQLPCNQATTSNGGGTPGTSTACGPGDGGGGTGGGGGSPNYTLNWGNPVEGTFEQIGGQMNYGGVGTVQIGSDTYVAYQNLNVPGELDVHYATTPTGPYYFGPSQTFPNAVNSNTPVTLTGGGQSVYSASNPTVAYFNNKLYVGYIDSSGSPTFVSTSDGTHYGTARGPVLGLCGNADATFSPSFVKFGSYLYMFYAQKYTNQLTVCRIDQNDNTQETVQSGSMGDSPSAVVFNNQIYIGIKANDSSNKVYLFTTPDGVNYSFNTGPSASHTSTAPSLAVRAGVLYIGSRQNDPNSHAFFYNYSTDGNTFSGPIIVNWSVGGPPSLVVSSTNQVCNVFRQNDYSSYLFAACAN